MDANIVEESQKKSQLVASLREGVSVVQMVLYKAVREQLSNRYPERAPQELPILAGSIINEVFGTRNPEPRFITFRKENWGIIEQELLSLKENNPQLTKFLTDALRIQVLCDSQEGFDSSATLSTALSNGYLVEEREIPLPSTFMTVIRTLGEQHGLIIAPVQITPEQDQAIIH